jgi:hypothetical protein
VSTIIKNQGKRAYHFQKKMFKDTSQKLNLSLLKYLDLGCKNICKVLDGKYFRFFWQMFNSAFVVQKEP